MLECCGASFTCTFASNSQRGRRLGRGGRARGKAAPPISEQKKPKANRHIPTHPVLHYFKSHYFVIVVVLVCVVVKLLLLNLLLLNLLLETLFKKFVSSDLKDVFVCSCWFCSFGCSCLPSCSKQLAVDDCLMISLCFLLLICSWSALLIVARMTSNQFWHSCCLVLIWSCSYGCFLIRHWFPQIIRLLLLSRCSCCSQNLIFARSGLGYVNPLLLFCCRCCCSYFVCLFVCWLVGWLAGWMLLLLFKKFCLNICSFVSQLLTLVPISSLLSLLCCLPNDSSRWPLLVDVVW